MSLTEMFAVTVVSLLLYATAKATGPSTLSKPAATKRIAQVYEGASDLEHYKDCSQKVDKISLPPPQPQSVSMKLSTT